MNQQEILIKFETEKNKLGRLHPGDIFLYKRRLWLILNRALNGKLVRCLDTDSEVSNVMDSCASVLHLKKGRKCK